MTTIQDVLVNLDRTIAGKQQLLETIKEKLDPIRMCGEPQHMVDELVLETTEKFLSLNLAELRNIREHLGAVNG